jgi:hypothetical protein
MSGVVRWFKCFLEGIFMRKLLSAFLLLALMVAVAPISRASTPAPIPGGGGGGGGAEPFPLTRPMKFPWETIEGHWVIRNFDGALTAFSFEKRADCGAHEILRVRQFSVVSGEVLAEGIGHQLEGSERVEAVMRGKSGTFLVYLGQYQNEVATPEYPAGYVGVIMRIVPFDNPEAVKTYEIEPLHVGFNFQGRSHRKLNMCDNFFQ